MTNWAKLLDFDLTLPDDLSCYTSAGWTLASYARARSSPAVVSLGKLQVPAAFEQVIHPKMPGRDGTLPWTVYLMYLVNEDAGEVALQSILTIKIEVDQALSLLKHAKPLEWWKRKALTQLAIDHVESTLPANTKEIEALAQIALAVVAAVEVPTTRRRDRVTDQLLREVAQVYRAAWEGGDPTAAVARRFFKSHSTAARWVGLARKAGHLDPTTPGRTSKPQSKGSRRG